MQLTLGPSKDEKLNWWPKVGRWQSKPLHFFGDWADADKGTLYRFVGEKACQVAANCERCDLELARVSGDITLEGGRQYVVEIQVERGMGWDDFQEVPFVECRVRLIPIVA
jgi:hypothetical protein